MSSTLRDDTHEAHAPQGERAHEHPSDWQYVKVAILLAVVTAAEVGTYFVELNDIVIGLLYGMMVAKFAVVGAYFMHLKFDSKIFRWVFVGGLALAVGVYLVVFAVFGFWVGDHI